MKESGEDLVIRMHREAVERIRREGVIPPLLQTQTIPFTELPPASPASPLFMEWDTYRQEVGRLLAERKQGQFVLIKGRQVIGFYTTEREALEHGYQLFPGQAFLVHQVQEREPLLRCVSSRPCRS